MSNGFGLKTVTPFFSMSGFRSPVAKGNPWWPFSLFLGVDIMRFLLFSIVLIFFNHPAHAACINPDGVPGELMYNGNYDVFQGCSTRGWKAFHAPGPFRNLPPKDCPDFGNTCADGTLFAGFHPVTGKVLFAMQEDAPTTLSWDNSHGTPPPNPINLPGNNTDAEPMNDCPMISDSGTYMTGIRSYDPVYPHPDSADPNKAAVTPGCHEGKRMTDYLASVVNASSPYEAEQYCANLAPENDAARALGHDDWYLPSINELAVMFFNLGPAPKNNFKSGYIYWSSSEINATPAWTQSFHASGTQNFRMKYFREYVRCIRQN